MGFNVKRVYATSSASGTLDTVVVNTVTAGTSLPMNDVVPGTLSALVTVDSETENLTQDLVWQVSNDGSTWYRAVNSTNTATTTLATGTAGADASVTRVIAAPDAVYGWRLARAGILSAGDTGTTSDTYSISYYYAVKPLS